MRASREPKPSTSIRKLLQPLRLPQARFELETDNAFAAAAQNFEKSRLHRKVADSETTFDLLFAPGARLHFADVVQGTLDCVTFKLIRHLNSCERNAELGLQRSTLGGVDNEH